MVRYAISIGAVLGLLGVMAGAFGAHLLEGQLDAEAMAVWDLAARYQIVHALALLGAGILGAVRIRADTKVNGEGRAGLALHLAAGLFTAGVIVFSGSLYALALTGIAGLGAITPIGGTALILGWAALAIAAWPRAADDRSRS